MPTPAYVWTGSAWDYVADPRISAMQTRLSSAEAILAGRGQANGLATLDSAADVPYTQLPTFLGADRVGVTRYAELASDITVVASATLVNAGALAFSVTAGGVYLLDGHLRYNSSTAADAKFALAGPAMAAMQWSLHALDVSVTSGAGSLSSNVAIAPGSAIAVGGTGTTAGIGRPKGVIKPSASGTLQLQFAQNTATSGVTSYLYAPSHLTLLRVA